MTGRRPMNALEGDYTGRGTWANATRYCARMSPYYGPSGHRAAMDSPCLQAALAGSAFCKLHRYSSIPLRAK